MKSTTEAAAAATTMVPGARTRVTSDPLLSSEPGRFLEMLLETTPPSPPWSDKVTHYNHIMQFLNLFVV